MNMGPNGKSIAIFGTMLLEVPDHVKVLLTYWVQGWSWYAVWPSMVQDSVVFLVVKFPVAAAMAGLVFYIRNHQGPQLGTLDRPADRPVTQP